MLRQNTIILEEALKEYVDRLKDHIGRDDVEYIMELGHIELLKYSTLYKCLSYLKNGIKHGNYYTHDLFYVVKDNLTHEEVERLVVEVLTIDWSNLRALYRLGYRSKLFNLIRDREIKPETLGYDDDNEIYEYFIRFFNIKYDSKYERYWEIFYAVDPSNVDQMEATPKNARRLYALGIRDVKYLRKIDRRGIFKYKKETAYKLICKSILLGEDPYDILDWEDESPYQSRLDSHIMIKYFREFRRNGIEPRKRYRIDIEKDEFIMDIIDMIDHCDIIRFYCDTGLLKEYVDGSGHTVMVTNNSIDRIIELKDRINCLIFWNRISVNTCRKLIGLNIEAKLCYQSLNILVMLLEYNIPLELNDIDNCIVDVDDRVIMYSNGLRTLYERYPKLWLKNILMKYTPWILGYKPCIKPIGFSDINIVAHI